MQKRLPCFRLLDAVFVAGLFLGSGALPALAQPPAGDLIRRIHPSAVTEFRVAWSLAGAGAARTESVVLVSFGADGRLYAKAQPPDNQHHRSAVRIHSGIAAVFHSHPNNCAPRPSPQDRRLADRLQVPIGTLTRQGLFVYDPTTRRTTVLMRRLDWLTETNWSILRSKARTNFPDAD